MKWGSRFRWILAMLVVFFVVIFTNLIDRNNFLQVRDSVVTLYEDRMVAKNLLFDMSLILRNKEKAALEGDSLYFADNNQSEKQQIEELMATYGQTQLTPRENALFQRLHEAWEDLLKIENKGRAAVSKVYLKQIEELYALLYDLNEVQMDVGRRQLLVSKRAIDSLDLFTKIEVYFLIALALVVQFLVLYNPKKK